MNLNAFMKTYAAEIGGQYTDYNAELSIVIVPVAGGRAQTVMGNIRTNQLYNRKLIAFTSKICPYQRSIDLQALLEQAAHFNYCRFVIAENYLQIEAVASFDSVSEHSVKEMVQEVANLADQFEMKLTGTDIN